MAILDTGDKNFMQIINEIKSGQVKIPQFQRKFVWDIKSSAKLIDSIIKGYPIGTFIYWRTNEELRSIRNLGNVDLPNQIQGEYINYVLDGQQRLTSFFAAVEGLKVERELAKFEDYSNIFLNLEDVGTDDDFTMIDITDKPINSFIRLVDLLKGDFSYLASFSEDKHEKIKHFKKTIESYNFRGINLKEADIDVATEVFTRLNVGGKELSLFEIMTAKTYDASKKFDLSEKYEELKKELLLSDYETIPASTVLQVVAILISKNVTRKEILKLSKLDFINYWDKATKCIKQSVDFLKNFGIPVSRLLPYNALIVPFSYFFYKHPNSPNAEKVRLLEDFFWRCSLGFRYSSGVEGKLVQDVEKVEKIINGITPKYEWSIDVSENYIKQNGAFTASKSYIKAILCLYAMNKPKSFKNNLDVTLDNSWLIMSTSKNYHHFFPKAWMKSNFPKADVNYYNHILNITIIGDELNKKDIRTKSPSEYIHFFAKDNNDISLTLKTHFIDNIETFGINKNDYDLFYNERATIISKELRKRIIEQTTGYELQIETYEFENET